MVAEQLTISFPKSICLSEDQKLRVLLTFKVAPCVPLPVVNMYILKYFVSVDNVLRLEILLIVYRLFVAQSKWVVMQRSTERLPNGDVLDSSREQVLCSKPMPSPNLSDEIIGRSVDVCHDVGLPVGVLLPSRIRERCFSFSNLA